MILIILIALFFVSTSPTLAIDEFSTDQDINYSLDTAGNASVTHQIKLTNNFSNIYAKQYVLKTSGMDVANVVASDSSGNILKSVDRIQDQVNITVGFSNPTTGKDQSHSFQIKYTLPSLATLKGKIWEIPLPQQSGNPNSFNLTLDTPVSFGGLAYSSLAPSRHLISTNRQQFSFSKEALKQKILLAFGNSQLFDFDLTYYLTNPNNTPITTTIPLPPDTETQKVIISQLQPPPDNVNIDPDGNWLAQYSLTPLQAVTVSAVGQVKILPQNTKSLPPTTNLTKAQPFWPTNDPAITTIAQRLNTPRQIYDYVVNTLTYDYALIDQSKRQGALWAINNPANSLCTEFTDLFVTLARAKGIPSREIEGYAYTTNPKIKPINTQADVLHAWPQFWDQSRLSWISIDPTWAKTTNGIDYFTDLDLNHITFVIHGLDSQYPLPPGSYKSSHDQKTVKINFAAQEILNPHLPLTLSTRFGLKSSSLSVKNPNPGSVYNVDISIPAANWSLHLDSLPPYSHLDSPIPKMPFLTSLLPQNQKITVTTSYDLSSPSVSNLIYQPHYINLTLTIAILLVILSAGGIIITIKRF